MLACRSTGQAGREPCARCRSARRGIRGTFGRCRVGPEPPVQVGVPDGVRHLRTPSPRPSDRQRTTTPRYGTPTGREADVEAGGGRGPPAARRRPRGGPRQPARLPPPPPPPTRRPRPLPP